MNWVAIDELSSKLPIPPGYRIEQLKRSEIPEVIHCFRDWFPDITVGAESCYQREDFYSREVSLEGEPERDVIVLLFKQDQELVAIVSLQRSEDTLTLYGRLGAIAPRYRGAKLAYMGPALLEAVGRAMGMESSTVSLNLRFPTCRWFWRGRDFRLSGSFLRPTDYWWRRESPSASTKLTMSKCWPPTLRFFARKPRV